MFKFIENLKKKKKIKNALIAFYLEIKKNLERYYVNDQRGTLNLFSLDVWNQIKEKDIISLVELCTTNEKEFEKAKRNTGFHNFIGKEDVSKGAVADYIHRIEDFNKVMSDFKEFEKWFTADIERKTKDNAQILHAKKEGAVKRFKGLDKIILPAQNEFEKKLIDLKIIKCNP